MSTDAPSPADKAALQALEHIPGWAESTKIAIHRIGSGNTNTSWVIERDGRTFVLRIDSPVAAELALDRTNEMIVRAHVSTAALAPRVIHSDSERGILLSDYAPGRAWEREDVLNEDNLLKLAQTLHRLHELPTVGAAFDPGRALKCYANQLGDDASQDCAQEALNILKTIGTRTHVICHNDLVAENIVAGEQLWLIDWEYAGVGDPLFDLAVVVEHHGVDKELALKFVEASLGGMSRQIVRDLNAYREVYKHLVTLWRAIV